MTHPTCALAAAALATAALAARPDPARAADPPRPILVTVDDLPVGGGGLPAGAADRQRVTEGLLAVLASTACRPWAS